MLTSFFNLGNFDFIEVLMRIVNVENKLFTIKMLEYGGVVCNDTIMLNSQITNILSVTKFYNSELINNYHAFSDNLEQTIVDDITDTEIKKCDINIHKLQVYNTILNLL